MAVQPLFSRVLLKISGEALLGDQEFGLDPTVVKRIADEIKSVHDLDVEIGVVVGGGNMFRGTSGHDNGLDRVSTDYMGMLATVINSIALRSALETVGVETRVLSALPILAVCESYTQGRAARHLEKKRVVLFAAGTGNPFFTTDTAAALRASEMGCDALLKATRVDGVYSADPVQVPNAVRYDRLSYLEVLSRDLRVMDAAAISLARENKIPILVFSLHNSGAFAEVVSGQGQFTRIDEEDRSKGQARG